MQICGSTPQEVRLSKTHLSLKVDLSCCAFTTPKHKYYYTHENSKMIVALFMFPFSEFAFLHWKTIAARERRRAFYRFCRPHLQTRRTTFYTMMMMMMLMTCEPTRRRSLYSCSKLDSKLCFHSECNVRLSHYNSKIEFYFCFLGTSFEREKIF
jgi:hypothetical protein